MKSSRGGAEVLQVDARMVVGGHDRSERVVVKEE